MGFQLYTHYQLLSDSGDTAVATVIGRHSYYVRSSKGGGSWHYELTYAYVANDRIYQNQYRVSSDEYNRAQEGYKFTVRYLKDNPTTVRPENYNILINEPLFLIVLMMFFIICSVVVQPLYIHQKNQYLKKHGRIIPGILEQATIIRKKNYHALRVNIAFQSPDSTEIIYGTRNYKPQKNQLLPEKGSRIYIFYVNSNNWQAL